DRGGLRQVRQALRSVQAAEIAAMAEPNPTMALASFAASFDPANLPAEVREKLGCLLLDFLRVSSVGARLPWSDWSRRYVDLVGKPGPSHALFSRNTVNPQ